MRVGGCSRNGVLTRGFAPRPRMLHPKKRLNDVKIEMEKTTRRMVALRAVDYKRKKELKGKNLRFRMSHSRVLQVVDSRAKWRARSAQPSRSGRARTIIRRLLD